jgi:hypothetical protein
MSCLIENVVLMGAPIGYGSIDVSAGLDFLSSHEMKWRAVRRIVSGRLINCYSTRDWVLALLFRTKALELEIAGLAPVILNDSHDKRSDKHSDENKVCVYCNSVKKGDSANAMNHTNITHVTYTSKSTTGNTSCVMLFNEATNTSSNQASTSTSTSTTSTLASTLSLISDEKIPIINDASGTIQFTVDSQTYSTTEFEIIRATSVMKEWCTTVENERKDVENVEVTDVIGCLLDYPQFIQVILSRLNIEGI